MDRCQDQIQQLFPYTGSLGANHGHWGHVVGFKKLLGQLYVKNSANKIIQKTLTYLKKLSLIKVIWTQVVRITFVPLAQRPITLAFCAIMSKAFVWQSSICHTLFLVFCLSQTHHKLIYDPASTTWQVICKSAARACTGPCFFTVYTLSSSQAQLICVGSSRPLANTVDWPENRNHVVISCPRRYLNVKTHHTPVQPC